MSTNDSYDFYNDVAKAYNHSQKAGCGCGCLTGLIVLGSVIASVLTPSMTFDKLGEQWQKPNPDAQRVIKTKRPYHEIQNNRNHQRN